MPFSQIRLTGWTRGSLAVLCLLLSLSLTGRFYRYVSLADVHERAAENELGGPLNMGKGMLLPRASAEDRSVRVDGCPTPSSIYFFQAGPYGVDASMVGSSAPGDRIAYIYDGWTLGNPLASVSINTIYFARRVYARVTTNRKLAADDLAVKIVIPAGCDVAPDDVMTAFRRAIQS